MNNLPLTGSPFDRQSNTQLPLHLRELTQRLCLSADYFVSEPDQFCRQSRKEQLQQLVNHPKAPGLISILTKIGSDPNARSLAELKAKVLARLVVDSLIEAGSPIKLSDEESPLSLAEANAALSVKTQKWLLQKGLFPRDFQETTAHIQQALNPVEREQLTNALLKRRAGENIPEELLSKFSERHRNYFKKLIQFYDETADERVSHYKISSAELQAVFAETKALQQKLLNTVKNNFSHQISPLINAGADAKKAFNRQHRTLATEAASLGHAKTLQELKKHKVYNQYPETVVQLAQALLSNEPDKAKRINLQLDILGQLADKKPLPKVEKKKPDENMVSGMDLTALFQE